jgi:catechol 2,3-dioxygenase-like lactoylglutathione lyase family enzyme
VITRPRVRAVTPLYVVSDLQRSIDFYCEKLGFVHPNVHGDPSCFAMMNRDGFDLMMTLAEDRDHMRPHGLVGVRDTLVGRRRPRRRCAANGGAVAPLHRFVRQADLVVGPTYFARGRITASIEYCSIA